MDLVSIMSKEPEEFPTVEGRYQMTKTWSINLPEQYQRRFADGNMALTRPGLIHWLAVWNFAEDQTAESTLSWVKRDRPPGVAQEFEPNRSGYRCWGYLQLEKTDETARWAFYSYTIGKTGYVQMATYLDDEKDLDKALRIWNSLSEQAA